MNATKAINAMTEPELNGSPTEFTKNISKALKYRRMLGASSLNTNNKIATPATLARIKFFTVTVL